MQITIDFHSFKELQAKLRDLLQQETTSVDIKVQENHLHIEEPSKEPLYKGKRWTQYEIDNVKSWYINKTYTAKEIGKALGRTPASVSQLIHALVKKGLPPRRQRSGKVTTS